MMGFYIWISLKQWHALQNVICWICSHQPQVYSRSSEITVSMQVELHFLSECMRDTSAALYWCVFAGCLHLSSEGEGHRGEVEHSHQRLECTDIDICKLQDSRRTLAQGWVVNNPVLSSATILSVDCHYYHKITILINKWNTGNYLPPFHTGKLCFSVAVSNIGHKVTGN